MSQSRRAPSRKNTSFFSRLRQGAKPRRRAIGHAERLELRQLMAADFNPHHNYWYAQDVNNDAAATPLDALLVINELNATGARKLYDPNGTGEGEDAPSTFMDVNGDGYLSPLDALNVVNWLNAEGEPGDAVEFRMIPVDGNGVPLVEIGIDPTDNGKIYRVSKDQRVGVSLQVLDSRPEGVGQFDNLPLGVFSAFVDMEFDPSKTKLGFSEIQKLVLVPQGDDKSTIRLKVDVNGTKVDTGNILIDSTSGDSQLVTAVAIDEALEAAVAGSLGVFDPTDRFSVASLGNDEYLIKFLGDYVGRNVPEIEVVPVALPVAVSGAVRTNANPSFFTLTTSAPHSFNVGNIVKTGGFTATQYNKSGVSITAVTANTITFQSTNSGPLSAGAGFVAHLDDALPPESGDVTGTITEFFSAASGLYTSRANMDQALNFGRLYTKTLANEGTNVFNFYNDVSPTSANIERVGALASGDTDFSPDPNRGGIKDTSYQPRPDANDPSGFENQGYIEIFRPYFIALNGTSGGTTEISINPPGFNPASPPGDDPELDPSTVLLLIGDTPGFDPKVRREFIDYGEPIHFVIQADVTAVDDVATVVEGSTDNAIPVIVGAAGGAGADGNNVSGETAADLFITGVGPNNADAPYVVAQGTVTIAGDRRSLLFTPATNFFGTFTFDYGLSNVSGAGLTAKDTGTVTITVTDVNDPPIASPVTVTLTEDATPAVDITTQILAQTSSDVDVQGTVTAPGEVIKVTQVTGATKGTVTVNPTTGAVTYLPNANASGTDNLTYTITDRADGSAITRSSTLTINITAVNDPPSFLIDGATHTSLEGAGAQTQTNFATAVNAGPADANPPETGTVTFTLTPVAGGSSTLTFTQAPTITVVGTTGTLAYTAAADAFGTAQFDVTASDGSATSTPPVRITINVTGVNDPPTFAVNAAAPKTFLEDESHLAAQGIANFLNNITVGTNESTTGQTVSFTVAIQSTTGGLTFQTAPAISSNGTLTFNPTQHAVGTATLRITAVDTGGRANGGDDDSDFVDVVITVNDVNDDVDAIDDTPATGVNFEAADGETTFIDVLANDLNTPDTIGVNGEVKLVDTTITPIGAFPAGVTVVARTDRSGFDVTVPDGLFDTTISFTYTMRDRATGGETDTATVIVALVPGELPRATPDTFPNTPSPALVIEDTNGPLAGGFYSLNVLANDRRSPANGALSVTGITFTSGGTLTTTPGTVITDANGNQLRIAADSLTVEFKPGPEVDEPVTFFYQVTEDSVGNDGPNVGTVVVNVTPVNDRPTFAIADNTVEGLEDPAAVVTVPGFASAITQGGGDSGQVLTFNVAFANAADAANFSQAPAINPANGDLTYRPAANANGVFSFNVTLTDNGGTANGGNDGTVTPIVVPFTITVTEVNDEPTFVKGTDPVIVAEDSGAQTVANWATGFNKGAANESGQTLSFSTVAPVVSNPSLFLVQPSVDPSTGTLTFTPADNTNGSATVTLTLTDDGGVLNGGDDRSVQSFVITITPVNDPPVATPATLDTTEDSTTGVTIDLRTLVSDQETADAQLVFQVTSGTGGTATLLADGFTARFIPALNFNGAANFTFRATDTGDGTAAPITTAATTITVNVAAVNDAPVITLTPVTTAEDTAVNVDLRSLVADVETPDSGLTFAVTNGTNGTVALQADGFTARFTPTAEYNGPATFNFTVTDTADGASGAITSPSTAVNVTVTPVNDPPVANGTTVSTQEDISIDIDLKNLASDQETTDANLVFTLGAATNGSVAFVPGSNNSIARFTPTSQFFGAGSFTFTARDTGDGTAAPITTAAATVSITITSVNDNPDAVNDNDPIGSNNAFRRFKQLTIAGGADFDVLANDNAGPANENQALTIVTAVVIGTPTPDAGSPTFAASGASITISTVSGRQHVHLNNPGGFFGDIVVEYTIRDSEGAEDVARANLDIVNFLPGNVSGVVWADVDGSETVNVAVPPMGPERMLSGIEIYMTGTSIFASSSPAGQDDLDLNTPGIQRVLKATTNHLGQYTFANVVPGSYTMSLDNPETVGIIENIELHIDSTDHTRPEDDGTRSNSYGIVFGEEGGTLTNINFGTLGLLPQYVNLRDQISNATNEGIVFGVDASKAAADQQYWYSLYDGWTGITNLKMSITRNAAGVPLTATLTANSATGAALSKTLSFTTDYLKIRQMGREGDNVVIRIVGDAQDIFPGAAQTNTSAMNGAQGEPEMYESGEGAQYAAAADAVYDEGAWA